LIKSESQTLCTVMTPALHTWTERNDRNRTAGEEVQTGGDLQSLYPKVYNHQSLSRLTNRQIKKSSHFCPEIGV